MTSSMLLIHAVDEAFTRMAKLYGRQFTSMFDGAEDLAPIKAAWIQELESIPGVLDRIAWALKNLPERCPNAVQFRNLCRQAPSPQQQAMQGGLSPVRGPTPAELQTIKALRDRIAGGSLFRKPGKEWADELVAKHERGEEVNVSALRMARSVTDAGSRRSAAAPQPHDPEDYLSPW